MLRSKFAAFSHFDDGLRSDAKEGNVPECRGDFQSFKLRAGAFDVDKSGDSALNPPVSSSELPVAASLAVVCSISSAATKKLISPKLTRTRR